MRPLTLEEKKMIADSLRAEAIDRRHGFTLPGDSALAILLNSWQEALAHDSARRRKALLDRIAK